MSGRATSADVRTPDTRQAVIEPSKAWMLGIVVEPDGSLAPMPAAALSFGPAPRSEARDREPLTCTCPDYCEIEHDAI